jgi:transcriptional regulator
LLGILGIEIRVEQVTAKFKYGGNVDEEHRRAVVERLQSRGSVGDEAAAQHVLRRMTNRVDDESKHGAGTR